MPKASQTKASPFHHCYLLRSTLPQHPASTYVGYTVDPGQRLRKHNGEIKGGARHTSRRGRPWEFVCVVGGFASHHAGLSFEWNWQKTWKAKTVNAMLPKAKQRALKNKRGVAHKLKCLLLLLNSEQWRNEGLTLYFASGERRGLLDQKAVKDVAYAKLPPGQLVEVCAVSDMPFAVAKKKKKTSLPEESEEEDDDDFEEAPSSDSDGSDSDSSAEPRWGTLATPSAADVARCAVCRSPEFAAAGAPMLCPVAGCGAAFHVSCLQRELLATTAAAAVATTTAAAVGGGRPPIPGAPTKGPCPKCGGELVWAQLVMARRRGGASSQAYRAATRLGEGAKP
ncbi:hypothetical protein TeGR_g9909, partial [Tetraparma gracilis]